MTREEFYVITTVAVIVISLCALGLTIWQGYITRKHNKLSVQPKLGTENELINGMFFYKISNKGLGTACVKKVDYFINGQAISFEEYSARVDKLYDINQGVEDDFLITRFNEDMYISKDETTIIFKGKFKDNSQSTDFWNQYRDKELRIKLHFECLYGHSGVITL